jgi:hypothetical protein
MTHIKISLTTKSSSLPEGYSLYQCGEDIQVLGGVRGCASIGCPAVMLLQDAPDTIFTDQWMYYLYAINIKMNIAAVQALAGCRKALMNPSGVGDPCSRRNVLGGGDLDQPYPRLDKLRTFSRNTHACREFDADTLQILTMDGNKEPTLKPGRSYPRNTGEVNPDDYLYHPKTHPYLFLVCNNIRTKPGNETSVFPFANGALYDWFPYNEPVSFFPLVSKFGTILSSKRNWNKVSKYENPYRRV